MEREQIIEQLFDTMNTLKRGMSGHMQMLNQILPIPRSQLELLLCIRTGQPISFKALAQQLYLTPGAVSQLADALEKHSLIIRESDTKDRRIQFLKLSKNGDKLLHDVEKYRRSQMDWLMQNLETNELAVWLRIQQKIIEQFKIEHINAKKKETK